MALSETHIKSLVEHHVWNEACPISHSELVYEDIEHVNFEGFSQIGELLVAKKVAKKVSLIFKELYHRRFPIHTIQPLNLFKGDDYASMRANNISAFNGRKIMNTDGWSSHAYGVAIDINPVQNPYLMLNQNTFTLKIFPDKRISNINRGVMRAGMVEDIVPVFAQHGFTEWGGNWALTPDYPIFSYHGILFMIYFHRNRAYN